MCTERYWKSSSGPKSMPSTAVQRNILDAWNKLHAEFLFPPSLLSWICSLPCCYLAMIWWKDWWNIQKGETDSETCELSYTHVLETWIVIYLGNLYHKFLQNYPVTQEGSFHITSSILLESGRNLGASWSHRVQMAEWQNLKCERVELLLKIYNLSLSLPGALLEDWKVVNETPIHFFLRSRGELGNYSFNHYISSFPDDDRCLHVLKAWTVNKSFIILCFNWVYTRKKILNFNYVIDLYVIEIESFLSIKGKKILSISK